MKKHVWDNKIREDYIFPKHLILDNIFNDFEETVINEIDEYTSMTMTGTSLPNLNEPSQLILYHNQL